MGRSATDFMSRHRDVLFSGTPAVFYSNSPQPGPIANSTGLLNQLQFGPSIELALALQPDLEHVYVVSGATTRDRSLESQARAEFRAFEGRVEFTYLSGLVTKDLSERLRTLPPHSAVYYVVVSQDGAGEVVQQMAYLSRVAAAANAPTYSWADVTVDAGIVGGRRRDQLAQMKAIATLALRVLRGERADDIPVSSPDTDVDAVDWRQLRRWGLDESRAASRYPRPVSGAEHVGSIPALHHRRRRADAGADGPHRRPARATGQAAARRARVARHASASCVAARPSCA